MLEFPESFFLTSPPPNSFILHSISKASSKFNSVTFSIVTFSFLSFLVNFLFHNWTGFINSSNQNSLFVIQKSVFLAYLSCIYKI